MKSKYLVILFLSGLLVYSISCKKENKTTNHPSVPVDTTQTSNCKELFFSEYVEGSGNNKALEIYNPTDSAIDLSKYKIKRYSNGSRDSSFGGTTQLSGILLPHHVFILVNGQTTTTPTSPACDTNLQRIGNMLDHAYPSPCYFNGNDAITLEKIGDTTDVIVDIFGKIGEDPGQGWSIDSTTNYIAGNEYWLAWTMNHTLIRKNTVKKGVTKNPGSEINNLYFNVALEWDSLPNNTWSNLGTHICNCDTTHKKK